MTESSPSSGPPSFEDPFKGDDVEQRLYGTILQTREPTTVSAFADDVGCDTKTARKYLEWFATLGIVTRHEGHPATYERNDEYFEWRRIIREVVRELVAEEVLEDIHNGESDRSPIEDRGKYRVPR